MIVFDALSRKCALLSILNAKLLRLEYVKDLYNNGDDFDRVCKACENLIFDKFYRFNGYLFK